MAVDLYLASGSPRRQELLQQLGVAFAVRVADVVEEPGAEETASDFVTRLALAKAQAIWQALADEARRPVLGADTEVVLDKQILGKPRNREHGIEMLQMLSGRTHQVLTGVALIAQQSSVCVNVSEVTFRKLDNDEIARYWDTGEPVGKAGGYAIQGYAAAFIEYLRGSYSGVMGLPLFETATLLRQNHIPIWQSKK